MVINDRLLATALAAREALEAAQDEVETARGALNVAIRDLHVAGGSLREIADALGLSHQRVHQIVEETVAAEPVETKQSGDLIHCGFCDKSQKQVKRLIAGPGVYICDECLDVVHAAVHGGPTDGRVMLTPRLSSKCSFCGKIRKKVAWLAQTTRRPAEARICNACVGLADNIVAEEFAGLS